MAATVRAGEPDSAWFALPEVSSSAVDGVIVVNSEIVLPCENYDPGASAHLDGREPRITLGVDHRWSDSNNPPPCEGEQWKAAYRAKIYEVEPGDYHLGIIHNNDHSSPSLISTWCCRDLRRAVYTNRVLALCLIGGFAACEVGQWSPRDISLQWTPFVP